MCHLCIQSSKMSHHSVRFVIKVFFHFFIFFLLILRFLISSDENISLQRISVRRRTYIARKLCWRRLFFYDFSENKCYIRDIRNTCISKAKDVTAPCIAYIFQQKWAKLLRCGISNVSSGFRACDKLLHLSGIILRCICFVFPSEQSCASSSD